MQIDCKNLPCPEPVIKTKKALEDLKEGEILEVLVNSEASLQNVTRFAQSQGYGVMQDKKENETILTIDKDISCDTNFDKKAKTLFIKDDKVGTGELGEKLIIGFLTAMSEASNLPKEIFFVNKGVFLTSTNEASIKAIKELEQLGCKIYSCGICLEHFDVKIQVGEIGNAFQTVESLLNSDGVLSL